MKKKLNEMMSAIPTEKGNETDLQILRVGIIAELDTVSLYEQMASVASSSELKNMLLDIAREEKTHIGEFESLLSKIDTQFKKEIEKGKIEAENNSSVTEASVRLYGKSSIQKLDEMKILFNKLNH